MDGRARVDRDELKKRVENGLALLRDLLGEDFPQGVHEMPHWRRLLCYGRAARKRKNWSKVRFLLQLLEPEARDLRAYAWKGVQGLDELRGAVMLASAKYREAAAALGALDKSLSQLAEKNHPLRADVRVRVRDIRKILAEEFSFSQEVPELLVALGTNRPTIRLNLARASRYGLTGRGLRGEVHELEHEMLIAGFSHSEIGTLVDGPLGTAKERSDKVGKRLRHRRRVKES